MNGPCAGTGGGALTSSRERSAVRYLTEGLRLAAAPTFLVLALLNGLPDGDAASEVLCITGDHTAPFSDMVAMYLLMSVFHAPPWLKLIA